MTIYAKAPFKHVTEFNNSTIADLFATPEFAEAAGKSGGSYFYAGDSSSVTNIDWSTASVQELNLTNNPTLTFSNGSTGKTLALLLKQELAGQRSVTWPSNVKWSNGTAPTFQSLYSLKLNPAFDDGSGFGDVVEVLANYPGNKILAGGQFNSYNGNIQYKIIMLNSDGSVDTTFITGTGFNSTVHALAVQSDGKILVGGSFTQFNGQTRNRIIRLNSDGSIDNTFNIGTGFNSTVRSISIDPDGRVIVGGDFTQYNGNTRNYIIRLNTDGSIDTNLSIGTGFNSTVYSTIALSSGQIVVGGNFTTYNGTTRNYILRLEYNGNIDNTFSVPTGFDGPVVTMTLQSDQKVLAGGFFTSYNTFAVSRIVRINTNGTIDGPFASTIGSGFSSTVRSISLQSDGKILIGGNFITFNGNTANYICRLNSDGSFDTTFVQASSGINNQVNSILTQPNGEIIVGGWFSTNYNGVPINRFANFIVEQPLDYNLVQFYYNGSNYVGSF
jgi:uncharacterized delta-60 repeat protein